MNPNKALWEQGDFTRVASSMRSSGEALVGRLGITRGMKVLERWTAGGIPAASVAFEPGTFVFSAPVQR